MLSAGEYIAAAGAINEAPSGYPQKATIKPLLRIIIESY